MFLLICIRADLGHAGASEQQEQGLFTAASVRNPNMADEKVTDPTVIRSRLVHINLRLLSKDDKSPRTKTDASNLLTLNLFDDVVFAAILDRLELNKSGSYTWIGHLDGIEQSQVVLVVKDEVMSGNITLPDAFYQVRYKGNGLHAVYRIDQSAFPSEKEPISIDTSHEKEFLDTTMADDGSFIDVLVVYTGAAVAAVGSTSAMETLIDLAVSETNTGYSNSAVTQRLNLAHTAEVIYDESGFSWSTTLSRLQNPSDGYMDNVHTLRDTYAADEVVLIVNNIGYCGLAYLMTSVSSAFASWAFSVVSKRCATGYYSFAHEMGHNMAARHDWYIDNTVNSPYTYNHGYVAPAKNWRTIMAYGNDCSSCPRLNYWSNPAVSYVGVPMGVAEGTSTSCSKGVSSPNCDADNHKTLNNTAYTVANFRQSASTCPSCPGGAVVLNGDTFPAGETCACTGTTISLLNVTVPSTATANFTATTSITVGTGTTFESGSTSTLTSPSTTFQPGSQVENGAVLNVGP